MNAAHLVRHARRSSHLTQRALAARVRVHQPAIAVIEAGTHDTRVDQLDRILAGTGHRLSTLPTWAATAAETGEVLFDALRDGSGEDRAFRALIGFSDGLTAQDAPLRVALCVTPPASCGDRRFDAALAAICEHHLKGLPTPAWVHDPDLTLADPWIVDRYARPDIAEHTPPALRRHGVLLDAGELASV